MEEAIFNLAFVLIGATIAQSIGRVADAINRLDD